MSVLERSREFAVLLAVGTSPGQLRAQVFLETVFLGVMGCALGLAMGGAGAWACQYYGVDLKSLMPEGIEISGFAMSTRLYAMVTPAMVAGLGGLVLGMILLMGLIPVRRSTTRSTWWTNCAETRPDPAPPAQNWKIELSAPRNHASSVCGPSRTPLKGRRAGINSTSF